MAPGDKKCGVCGRPIQEKGQDYCPEHREKETW